MNNEELKEEQLSKYNILDNSCPYCSHYPLEYQIYQGEREVFCSNCDYCIIEEL